MIEIPPTFKSLHQTMVEEFMRKAGQDIPTIPTEYIPLETRILRAKLIMEEALETIQIGLGISVTASPSFGDSAPVELEMSNLNFEHSNGGDLTELVDGCCDLKVVTTGTLSAYGVPDMCPQAIVDQSNLNKFGPGAGRREDGKWLKPSDWVPPTQELMNFLNKLQEQG